MNFYLKGYRLLTGLGIVQNLVFAFSAFFYPAILIKMVGSGHAELFEGPWLFNTGMFILLCAILYAPTVVDPVGQALYTRLVPWTRIIAAIAWIIYLLTAGKDLPGSFWVIPASDGGLGVITLFLASRGLPPGAGRLGHGAH